MANPKVTFRDYFFKKLARDDAHFIHKADNI
jgi:hypothetical protein